MHPRGNLSSYLLKTFRAPVHLNFVHLVFGYPPLEEYEEQAVNEEYDGINDPSDRPHVESPASTISMHSQS